MNIYIRAQLCTITAVVASKECTSTAVVASKEERELFGANSEKISPPSASEAQTKVMQINVFEDCRRLLTTGHLLRNASHSRKTAPPKIYGPCVINTQQYEYRSCQQNINVTRSYTHRKHEVERLQ